MAVPPSQRGENKLEVAEKAALLEKHTLELTSNENVFDRKYLSLILRIEDAALSIGLCIWMANDIRVNSAGDLARRRALQGEAIAACESLMHLIGVAKVTFGLRKNKAHNWTRMADEVRALCAKWRESDSRRYGDL